MDRMAPMIRSELVDRDNPTVVACNAVCVQCGWRLSGGAHYPYGHVQRAVRRHVIDTDHDVKFTKTCVTTYRAKAIA